MSPCQGCRWLRAGCLGAADDEQAALVHDLKSHERHLQAGECLLDGTLQYHAQPLAAIREGIALRCRTLDDGRRQVVDLLGPGDLAGLQARIDRGAAHDIVALTPLTVCVFDRGLVAQLQSQSPELARRLLDAILEQLGRTRRRLLSVGRHSARERIADLMLGWIERFHDAQPAAAGAGSGPPGGALDVHWPWSQTLLAEATGLSLVHTHRVLRQLVREGLIAFEGDRLRLPDRAALAAIVRRDPEDAGPAAAA